MEPSKTRPLSQAACCVLHLVIREHTNQPVTVVHVMAHHQGSTQRLMDVCFFFMFLLCLVLYLNYSAIRALAPSRPLCHQFHLFQYEPFFAVLLVTPVNTHMSNTYLPSLATRLIEKLWQTGAIHRSTGEERLARAFSEKETQRTWRHVISATRQQSTDWIRLGMPATKQQATQH